MTHLQEPSDKVDMPAAAPSSQADWTQRLRIGLLVVLDQLDSKKARDTQVATTDAAELLELVRSYRIVPPALKTIVRQVHDHVALNTTSDEVIEALAETNSWLKGFGLPSLNELEFPDWTVQIIETAKDVGSISVDVPKNAEKTSHDAARPKIAPAHPPHDPLPQSWEELVVEVRRRLLSSDDLEWPFSSWVSPRPRWSSRWIDTFAVVSCNADDSKSAIVIVPSEAAAQSDEATQCWRRRIQAARNLKRHPTSQGLARVSQHGDDNCPAFIVLQRSEIATRSLADHVLYDNMLSPRKCVELGIALCQNLQELNGLGVHVLDLPLASVVFEWGEGHRFTQLLDPTAVIPGIGLLPEWRGAELNVADAIENDAPDSTQVFLIGALILSLLCNTTEELKLGNFPEGQCATFASLAGHRELSSSDANQIAAPLTADLDRRNQRIDAARFVEALRWSLAEHRSDRFSSLQEFSNALRRSLG